MVPPVPAQARGRGHRARVRHGRPELVREAAKEAVGYFDLLVVCGFAFDSMADEERSKVTRLGGLTVSRRA